MLDATQTVAWTFPNAPESAAAARRAAVEQLARWDLDELVDATALIVSELVTNGVRYADGPVELRLIRDRALICEVADDSSAAPGCAAPTTPTRVGAACSSPPISPIAGGAAEPPRQDHLGRAAAAPPRPGRRAHLPVVTPGAGRHG
ncbi:ATP-binding protein [Kitasatospora paranensis]|uniref:ATP-binding protein n=1 Tax=Kitasatospora paranensis TaxID=258053 RepID=UPI003CD06DB3